MTSCLRASLCWVTNRLVLPSKLSPPAPLTGADRGPTNSFSRKVVQLAASSLRAPQAALNSLAVREFWPKKCCHLSDPLMSPIITKNRTDNLFACERRKGHLNPPYKCRMPGLYQRTEAQTPHLDWLTYKELLKTPALKSQWKLQHALNT